MCKATPQQPVCYKMAYATSWPQRPRGQTQHLCSGTPAGPGPGFAGRARGRQPAAQHARCMMPCWCMVQLGVRHAPSASQRRCITRSCLPDSAACSVALAAPAGPQGHGSDPPQCGYPSARRPLHRRIGRPQVIANRLGNIAPAGRDKHSRPLQLQGSTTTR